MRDYPHILSSLDAEGRLRSLSDNKVSKLLDFSSNDYLGIGKRSDWVEEFLSSSTTKNFTASASRLLMSSQDRFFELENFLGALYKKHVLLFNSGYHANTGLISALANKDTLIVCDKLIHASAIDGIVLSKSPFERFRHNDLHSLQMILDKNQGKYSQILLIVESIYSMDGDIAPLKEIVDLKKQYPEILLYVDEAHAFGVRGDKGLGVCEEIGILNEVDVLVGTFGKACASMGAFVATSDIIKKYIINSARSLIFSTAMPPISVAWTLFVVKKIIDMTESRSRLKLLSGRFNDGLQSIGIGNVSQSQIIPWIVGDSAKAVKLSSRLCDEGYLALPIRRPTVPPGTERIRFSLNADIELSAIDSLIETIKTLQCE